MLAVVQEIGGAAGLAAVVGLAVLSALYLSQARDVKRLRDWAGRAPEASLPVPPSVAPQPVRRTPSPQRPTTRRIGIRYVAVALVGLLVLAGAAAYGVTQLTGDDGGNKSGNPQAKLNKPKRNVAAVTPGNVTVAVLNATTVPGLAAMLRDQIGAAGFQKGMINDFSDQQRVESVVQYAPGHEAEATAVTRTLGISQREPVTADTRALAGDATVIVIAGADKAP